MAKTTSGPVKTIPCGSGPPYVEVYVENRLLKIERVDMAGVGPCLMRFSRNGARLLIEAIEELLGTQDVVLTSAHWFGGKES